MKTAVKSNTTSSSKIYALDNLEEVKRTIKDIKSTMREIKSSNDKTLTKFGGLNFGSGHDANVWCEVNLDPYGYKWIFDFHIILQ